MVYDVNVKQIKNQLNYLAQCQEVLRRIHPESTGLTEKFAVERALHLAVECMIDIGSVMIDGFIMRDPGGYLDIVDILLDETVISTNVANKLKNHVQLRERLVRYYDKVTWTEVRPVLEDVDWYTSFSAQVESYLKRELGADCLA
ncbi:DUF86 domain-containing protein [Laceyella sacchari]|jgi:uncharacterized protein YutE (UPF0331/DUF86 family)|uniref:Uncharacterized conserved protein YutE, UPF0331/DUF86 family n=2 Tax=Laceyella TaxID=292635 RepID=A0AA45WIK2_9BACL|nr:MULTISPECIES: DUF86 domain-containing protein [Laceyella]KPC69351.1 hypothetical protein ADL26_18830 [Thermoactinomyces vulgaris]AUS07907.1 DUF86 domain-containing protein [Laceyella sacchari]MRG28361.1 DUF86 domain-containing protein [Laceyella tengchongensis]PRZ13933.1 uncharacterized protein YutE (UPF0331/DUF86 family) [Laceyella sediminis]TCW40472.1 uncharacterized protein YutE (UPF0331/DUF86 family) [Laceyella sacchari]